MVVSKQQTANSKRVAFASASLQNSLKTFLAGALGLSL